MGIKITGHAKHRAECGHECDIPVSRLEGEHQCVTCGATFSLPEDRLRAIHAELDKAAQSFALNQTREQVDKVLRGIASRNKSVTYKPGR